MSIQQQTIFAQYFGSLHIDLLGVQNNFLGGTGDLGVDLHDTLILPGTTKL
jgi:hypothetical protein